MARPPEIKKRVSSGGVLYRISDNGFDKSEREILYKAQAMIEDRVQQGAPDLLNNVYR